MTRYLLALDQGTTSSRAMVFDETGRIVSSAQREFPQHFPAPGHVEHDPEDIWSSQITTAQVALRQAQLTGRDLAAIGVTNQRETTVLWERATGRPVAPAIVWQSRITAERCERLRATGAETLVRERTGLQLDAYFSATKIAYLLDTVPGLRARAGRGEIAFGTVDSFLLWRLSGGQLHLTDPSNASRTLLYNIHQNRWDDELLKLFDIPAEVLPTVLPTSHVYGTTERSLFGHEVPIAAAVGDQQAALFGQACFEPGTTKNTYGTGCFLVMNTGSRPIPSQRGLLTTIAWQLGNEVTYALEGSVFVAGAAIQWLRDALGVLRTSAEAEELAASLTSNEGVYLVPAFVGLGAPWWDSDARGTIVGLTRGSGRAHLVRAALEAMAYQTADVLTAMRQDSGIDIRVLRVDGGATANNWMLQFQADVLGTQVQRPSTLEITSAGAAGLAGLAVGVYRSLAHFRDTWQLDREFTPSMDPLERNSLLSGWHTAVTASRNAGQPLQ